MGLQVLDNFKKIDYKNIKKDSYLISVDGKIFSLLTNKILKQKEDKDGYKSISLQTNDGSRVTERIATLVLYTFIGKPPLGMKDPTVEHIDGNKTNNNYKNLKWLERGVNSSTRKIKPKGELNGQAILNEEKVLKICELLKENKMSQKEIANMFGVKESIITSIKTKKTWGYLTKDYIFEVKNQKNKKDSLIQKDNIIYLLLLNVEAKDIIKNGFPGAVVYRYNKMISGTTGQK